MKPRRAAKRSPYHCYDVWEHTARAVEAAPPLPLVRWALLFHDLGKPETFSLGEDGRGHFYGHWRPSVVHARNIMERLRFDHQSRDTILTLVERHDCQMLLSEKAVRRSLARYGEETVRLLLAVKRADNLAQAPQFHDSQVLLRQWEELLDLVLQREECFSLAQLAVKGNDLTELGIKGKAVGEMLRTLLEMVIEERLPNDKHILLGWVGKNIVLDEPCGASGPTPRVTFPSSGK